MAPNALAQPPRHLIVPAQHGNVTSTLPVQNARLGLYIFVEGPVPVKMIGGYVQYRSHRHAGSHEL